MSSHRKASDFDVSDLKKHRQYDERSNKEDRSRDPGREIIVRSLKDALDKGRIKYRGSDKFHASKAEEARKWIRNPSTGFPSLEDCCEWAKGAISPITVQNALDKGLEDGCAHPLESTMGEALKELTRAFDNQAPTVHQIASSVAEEFGVDREGMLDAKRGRSSSGRGPKASDRLLEAFQWTCYLSYEMTEKTYSEVAEALQIGKSTARKHKYAVDEKPDDEIERMKSKV
jgi:hypothetical protein